MKRILLLALTLCLAGSVWAQSSSVDPFDEPPIGPDRGGPGNSTPTAPIDGGASLLAFAGASYAVKRLKKSKAIKA